MEKILVSACLLGQAVRYDGGHKRVSDPVLQRWLDEERVISVCPELAGGLPVPRPAAEIEYGGSAAAVLQRSSRVITAQRKNVSPAYVRGAHLALALAKQHNIRIAVLKEGSPSCGSSQVYDGSFQNKRIAGMGVTAALLREMDLQVFSESQFAEAQQAIERLA